MNESCPADVTGRRVCFVRRVVTPSEAVVKLAFVPLMGMSRVNKALEEHLFLLIIPGSCVSLLSRHQRVCCCEQLNGGDGHRDCDGRPRPRPRYTCAGPPRLLDDQTRLHLHAAVWSQALNKPSSGTPEIKDSRNPFIHSHQPKFSQSPNYPASSYLACRCCSGHLCPPPTD